MRSRQPADRIAPFFLERSKYENAPPKRGSSGSIVSARRLADLIPIAGHLGENWRRALGGKPLTKRRKRRFQATYLSAGMVG